MKKIFGALCCVTFLVTALAYTPVVRQLARQNSESSTLAGEAFEYDKAIKLTAVGWEGCKWCEKFKTEVIPSLEAEGYDVEYVDRDIWEGPRIRTGPTLFFFGERGLPVKIHQGFLTAEEVKEFMEPEWKS